MANLNYSNDALNVLSQFYGAEKILYVEGEDDVVFWESMLEKFEMEKVKVKAVSGLPELEKLIEKMSLGEINSLAARDRDYTDFKGAEALGSVLYTYGHSIENTLLYESSIMRVLKTYGRLGARQVRDGEFWEWLDGFNEVFELMVIYEAAKERKGCGILIMGDNCSRFMEAQDSHSPCSKKIKAHLRGCGASEELDDILEDVENRIKELGRKSFDYMRGHFLFSGCLKFANYKLGQYTKKKISKDGFFSGLVLAFQNTFDDGHPHYEFYQNEMQKILNG
ncbi:DUF4435 domain-containing protein [Halomonas sp. A29]|uniref:DUF4435 domain-containing protein n=1 Tax=Halomonas sp. A29 TaxID=3102786 RepID=UPI00398B2C3F